MNLIGKIFRRAFKGLISLLPIILILVLLNYLLDIFIVISKYIFGITNSVGTSLYLSGLLLLILYLIGFYYEKNKKVIVQILVENVIKKIPFIKTLFNIIEDMLSMFFKEQDDKYLGVLEVEYGGYPQYAFITKDLEEENRYIVFVPTAPNPTNGFVILLDKDNPKYPYKKIDIEPKEALSRVISLGLTKENKKV